MGLPVTAQHSAVFPMPPLPTMTTFTILPYLSNMADPKRIGYFLKSYVYYLRKLNLGYG